MEGRGVKRFYSAVGAVLRRARKARSLTLQEMQRRSSGRFKPSSVGGYERGERAITLERFCELASLCGVPPDRLLAAVLFDLRPEGRREMVIDLNRLGRIEGQEALLMAEYTHRVREQRGDYLTNIVTLRAGDLEGLALASGLKPQAIMNEVRPAVHPGGSLPDATQHRPP